MISSSVRSDEMLVSTGQLAQRLGQSDLVICGCRHDVSDVEAGSKAHLQSHIAGARFFHTDQDLSGPKTGKNGRHPLPDPGTFAAKLGAMGIESPTSVIAYDGAGGVYAARLWWMLRWLGHERVALLDGGFSKWKAEGRPVESATPNPEKRTYLPKRNPVMEVDVRFVLASLKNPTICLLDARSPDRFEGRNETIDPIAGHIPGSRNRFFKLNLDEKDCFRDPKALRNEFTALLDGIAPEQVVHQCGSGVTACHNLFAMELAGLQGSKLYLGSWSEWCADPDRISL